MVGPSGSGESTALRMLAGLEDVDEGEIRIGGKDMSRIRADIVALQSRLNTTAVYVTHDQAEARTMGDRLALLTAASCGR